jgi:acetyl esterase
MGKHMRISFRILLALLVLGLPIWTFAQTTPVEPQPIAIDGAMTHVYKVIDGAEMRLHVFNPPNHSASEQRPAILFFFGGGWAQGGIEQFVPQSKYLAQRGMVAIVVDYRVFRRHNTSPFEAMADAKSAIRWVRSRANELGLDPDRIVASGGSAGGHIALSAAVFDSFDEASEDARISSKPNALILFNPVVDTEQRPEFGARGEEGSPLHHIVRNLPPMAIFHGKADTAVPYIGVEKFCGEARKLENICELFGYEGATHGFFNPPVEEGKWYRETLLEADRFLTNINYLLKPTPTQIEQ